MAFCDDRQFLLSHIHHSFITCDDTGMCEMAMLNELVTDSALLRHQPGPPKSLDYRVRDYYADSDLADGAHSYDIVSGMGFIGGHRHRSNTAQRLEKLKRDRQNQAKITHIQWRDNPEKLSEKQLALLFPRKDLLKQKEAPRATKSALSEALELFPAAPNNPFNEYARFDGRVNRSSPFKKIQIYLMMQEERNFPLEVICLSNARVHELVGLICWMYTNEGREPKLKPSVSSYCLKIAEETGEVDEDFPSLDANEFVGKFGFPCLALIEKEVKDTSLSLTMYLEDNQSMRFDVPNLNLTLREAADLTIRKFSVKTKSDVYHMERIDDPGISISLDEKLSSFENLVFRLVIHDAEEEDRSIVKSYSKWQQSILENAEYDSHMKAIEAPLYRSFTVTLCQKMGINYEVQLGISGEKVEINPLPAKGAAKLLGRQQKPATLYMDTIGACEMMSKRYNAGKSVFKLVQQTGSEFKKYTFETDPQTAQNIVRKVQTILEMLYSSACKEYQQYREQKLARKTGK